MMGEGGAGGAKIGTLLFQSLLCELTCTLMPLLLLFIVFGVASPRVLLLLLLLSSSCLVQRKWPIAWSYPVDYVYLWFFWGFLCFVSNHPQI